MSVVVGVHSVDEGTGTHISVFVYVSDGQFDALEFPFKEISWKTKSQVYQYIEADSYSEGQSFNQFNTTKNCQYLKDDCLVFRISVNVPSYKLQCTYSGCVKHVF